MPLEKHTAFISANVVEKCSKQLGFCSWWTDFSTNKQTKCFLIKQLYTSQKNCDKNNIFLLKPQISSSSVVPDWKKVLFTHQWLVKFLDFSSFVFFFYFSDYSEKTWRIFPMLRRRWSDLYSFALHQIRVHPTWKSWCNQYTHGKAQFELKWKENGFWVEAPGLMLFLPVISQRLLS